MNFSVETGMYPLGSCTMKYNPKVSEAIASSPKMREAHPLQHDSTVQGLLAGLLRALGDALRDHRDEELRAQHGRRRPGGVRGRPHDQEVSARRGERGDRTEILVPDSAHGTNPASAAMAGFEVVKVPSDENGQVRVRVREGEAHAEDGRDDARPSPIRSGIFEPDVEEISKAVHDAGGLMYYDGANMNALLGKARPGDMGFDVVHLNLHKTFATPHGGGGPGAGPVGASAELQDYLPVPMVEKKDGDEYRLDYARPKSIGRLKGILRELRDPPQGVLSTSGSWARRAGQRLEPRRTRGELPPLEAEPGGILDPASGGG